MDSSVRGDTQKMVVMLSKTVSSSASRSALSIYFPFWGTLTGKRKFPSLSDVVYLSTPPISLTVWTRVFGEVVPEIKKSVSTISFSLGWGVFAVGCVFFPFQVSREYLREYHRYSLFLLFLVQILLCLYFC